MRALSPRGLLEEANVEIWRLVGRGTLLVALGASALQYHLLHVYVEILSLPALVVMT
jgi:hypothetical protein